MPVAELPARAGTPIMPVIWNGERMREIRRAAGLSQEELAKLMGMTQGGIGHWERGIRVPGADELYTLSDALGVECGAFRQPVGTRPAGWRGKWPVGDE